MGSIMGIVSIAVGVLLGIGFLIGFLRSWRRSTLRLGFLIACFIGAIFLTSFVSKLLMDKFVHGLVISAFGFTFDVSEYAGELAGDLLTEGSAITNFATALLNIIINIVGFLIVFIALCIVSFIIYLIVAGIMSSKRKKKAVGKIKTKGWERLIGGVVGAIGSLVLCMALFTPVFGIMSVCDKFLETPNTNAASAYSQTTMISGKFYTEDSKIGTVETYLEKYDNIKKEYNSSFAGSLFKYTGVDFFGKTTFKKLSTVKQNTLKVSLTDECVNIVKCYNIYKANFVEKNFDVADNKCVDAIKSMYDTIKQSEVLKAVVMDIVPKMADKWSNGEQFMGMDFPVEGDTGDLALEVVNVFNTDSFSVFDENICVIFDALKVANNKNVIKSINEGKQITDVIDEDDLVKEEILTLSKASQLRKALPNIMNKVIKFAYNSAIGDPGTKFDEEITQDKIASINWENEATQMQTIVSEMFGFFGNTDTKDNLLGNLSGFGKVIDAARKSVVLSGPLKILMTDYIDQKVDATTLGAGTKSTILTTIDTKWTETNTYSFASLFDTIQSTANVAQNISTANFNEIGTVVKELLDPKNAGAKETILSVVESGVLENFLGAGDTTTVFTELLTDIVNHTSLDTYNEDGTIKTKGSIDADIAAGQAIVDIISNSNTNEGKDNADKTSIFTGESTATKLIGTLADSSVIVDAATSTGAKTAVQSFISNLKTEDKTAIEDAIVELAVENENREKLAELFGVDLFPET